MYRKYTALLLALVLLLATSGLTGCGLSTRSTPVPPEDSPESSQEPSSESSALEELPPDILEEEDSASEESEEVLEESSQQEAPPVDTPPTTNRKLHEVDKITDQQVRDRLTRSLEDLEALDNTAITWGPGPTSNEVRPMAPLDLQARYGEYGAWFIAPSTNKIYLSFDEGYDAGYNGTILDTLKEKQVSAIFFVTLDFVKTRPDLIQRMVDEGHVLGNHTARHIAFPKMEPMDIAKDILYLHDYVKENFGYEMTLCRPPEGAFSVRSLALLQSLGYESIFWSFAYRDWILEEQPAPEQGLEKVVGGSHPGAIYLLHAVSSTNATILADVIDALEKKGYSMAVLSAGQE